MHDLDAIKAQLDICSRKARHLRLLDTKQWPEYSAMLTDDFVLDLGEGSTGPVVQGRDMAVKQVRASVEGLLTVHQAHLGEFELLGDEVKVTWAMNDRIVRGADQPSYTIYGFHHDRWVRQDGQWKLAELRLSNLLVEAQPVKGNGTPK